MALHFELPFNPEIVELRRAGCGFAVLELPELSTQAVFPVDPPCLDASDDDAVEEDWLEDQMQESLENRPRRSDNDRRANP